MKINRNYQDPKAITLGEIKNVHPFLFPEGASLGCDQARVYVRIYPCRDVHIEIDRAVGTNPDDYILVVDLEQGGIKAVLRGNPVIELEAELNVKGPVQPRQWGGQRR